MAMNDIRLWHVTALWQRKDAHLKKEFIASAPTKEAAIKSAESRLPINIRKADGYKTSARDLGTIKDNKIWFSSDVTSNAVIRIDDPLVTSELIDLFTLLWGQEIGWRSTNQSATEKDKLILNRLRDDKNRRELIPQWADECLQFPETDTSDFFRTKLSEYLGSDVKNMEDMIPVSDDEYDMIMSNARNKANAIINEARQSADDIRTQLAEETANLAKIAAALTGQMSWRNVTSNVASINTDVVEDIENKEEIPQEIPQESEPETETSDIIVNDETQDDVIEMSPDDNDDSDTINIDNTEPEEPTTDTPLDITDTEDDIPIDENVENHEEEPIDETIDNSTTDDAPSEDEPTNIPNDENDKEDNLEDSDKSTEEPTEDENDALEENDEEEEADNEPAADDYFDDFPDWDEFDETPTQEDFHIYHDEDFEPSIDDLISPSDNTEDEDEEKNKTENEDDEVENSSEPLISEQKAYEMLLSFQSDILLEAIDNLTIITIDKGRRKKKNHAPAKKTLNEAYPITPDMSEADKVAHLVKFIDSCDDKNGMPATVYVYTKYTIPEDTDDEPFT